MWEWLEELPYRETINLYLEKVPAEELQQIICKLVKGLLRSRAFEQARIRERYWQVIVDGTQLTSSRKELEGGYISVGQGKNMWSITTVVYR